MALAGLLSQLELEKKSEGGGLFQHSSLEQALESLHQKEKIGALPSKDKPRDERNGTTCWGAPKCARVGLNLRGLRIIEDHTVPDTVDRRPSFGGMLVPQE